LNDGYSGNIQLGPEHGDLHYRNVLIANNSPYIIDYGLAGLSLPIGADVVRLFGSILVRLVALQTDYQSLSLFLFSLFEKQDDLKEIAESEPMFDFLLEFWNRANLDSLKPHLYAFSLLCLKWDLEEKSQQIAIVLGALALGRVQGIHGKKTLVLTPISINEKKIKCIENNLIFSSAKGTLNKADYYRDLRALNYTDVEINNAIRNLEDLGAISIDLSGEKDEIILNEDLKAYKLIINQIAQNDETELYNFSQTRISQNYISSIGFTQSEFGYLAVNASLELVRRIFSLSPTNLLNLINGQIPKPSSIGGNSPLFFIISTLEADLLNFPELMLEPGLIDDILQLKFDDFVGSWKQIKLRQIVEYHKVFDKMKIAEQWLLTNKWELEDGGYNSNSAKSMTIKHHNDGNGYFAGVDDLFIASHRTGIPFKVASTGEQVIQIDMEDENQNPCTFEGVTLKGGFDASQPNTQQVLNIMLPVNKFNISPTKLTLTIDPPPHKDWNCPIFCKFKAPYQPKGRVTITFSLEFNWGGLSCKEAHNLNRFLNSDTQDVDIYLSKKRTEVNNSEFRDGGIINQEIIDILPKLIQIEELLDRRIDFPFFGIPTKIQELFGSCELQTKNDAEILWSKINILLSHGERQYVSPIITEVQNKDAKVAMKFLTDLPGCHQPTFSYTTQDKLDRVRIDSETERLSQDPLHEFGMGYGINLTAQSGYNFLLDCYKEKQLNCLDDLFNHKTTSVEEFASEVEWKWLSHKQHDWYFVTPFLISFKALSDVERLKAESSHLADQSDYKRAYIAARQAWELDFTKNRVQTGLQFSWSAFLVGRIDEAIEVANTTAKSLEVDKQILWMNIGLFYLHKAQISPETTQNSLNSAHQFYQKTLKWIKKSKKQKDEGFRNHASMAVKDLTIHKDKLHDHYTKYIEQFSGFLSSESSE